MKLRRFVICIAQQMLLKYEIKVNEVISKHVKMRSAYRILVEYVYGRDHLRGQSVYGRIILK